MMGGRPSIARLLAAAFCLGCWLLAAIPATGEEAAPTWVEAWRLTFDEPATWSTPVVAPGRVYLAGSGTLLAFDADDGELAWSVEVGEGFATDPTLVGDALYVGNQDGTLLALGAEDGEPLWRATGLGWMNGRPLVADGVVYVNASDEGFGGDGVLVALEAATGAERWRADLGGGTSAAAEALGDAVYANGSDRETAAAIILAFDAATGRELWRSDPAARLGLRGAGADQLYATAPNGDLLALGPDGGERWRFDAGSPLTWTLDGPLEVDGVLYAGTDIGQGGPTVPDPQDAGVFALDADTGELLWKTVMERGVQAGPVAIGDGLAVLSGLGQAPAILDRATGELRWQASQPKDATPRVIGAGDDLLVVGYQGGVVAFRPAAADGTTPPAAIRPPAPVVIATRAPTRTPAATATATATATPDADSASLTVTAFACPVAYAGGDYGADCAEPLAGIGFRLVIPGTEFSREGTTDDRGRVAFDDLGANSYALAGGVPAEFAVQTVACGDGDGPIPVAPPGSEIPGGTVAVGAGQAIACSWYVIPEDLRGEPAGSGSVAVSVHLCKVPPADPSAECGAWVATGVVVDGPVQLTTDAASDVPVRIHGVSWVWGEEGGVPLGTYYLQTGGIAIPPGYELSDVRGSFGASGNGWAFDLDEANPSARLAVVYVEAAPLPVDPDADADADRLPDGQEAEFGTDPANPDTDGDGLFDGDEVAPTIGTDPTSYDTDGDGFGDNQEVSGGSNPLDPASTPPGEPGLDSDGDLLTDVEEARIGTDPSVPDTDGDGLTDFGEVGFEPGSSSGTDPLVFDSDGDGVGDGAEVAAGTDPTDPTSL